MQSPIVAQLLRKLIKINNKLWKYIQNLTKKEQQRVILSNQNVSTVFLKDKNKQQVFNEPVLL